MALSILTTLASDGTTVRFRAGLGTNKFYAYVVGDGRDGTVSSGGITRLDPAWHRSALMGPIPPERRGMATIEIPREAFDRSHRHVQLFTFRTRELEGPAISSIVEVPLGEFTGLGGDELPPPLMMGNRMASATSTRASRPLSWREPPQQPPPPANSAALEYNQSAVSHAMFIQALIGPIMAALPTIGSFLASNLPGIISSVAPAIGGSVGGMMPMLAKLVPSLLGAVGPGAAPAPAAGVAPGAPGAPAAPATPAATPGLSIETIRAIADMIQRAAGPQAAPATNVNINQTTTASPNSSAVANGQRAAATSLSSGQTSRAQALPLAALIPLIPQLLGAVKDLAGLGLMADRQQQEHLERLNPGVTPQDLFTLLQAMDVRPPRVVVSKATTQRRAQTLSRELGVSQAQALPLAALIPMIPQLLSSLKDFVTLGIAADRQLQDHLERLNPGVNPQDLFALMHAMSVDDPIVIGRERFKASSAVTISLAGVTPQMLDGREVLVYRHGRELAFPVDVSTPRMIRKATVEMTLTDPSSRRVVATQRVPVENIQDGRLSVTPRLSASSLQRLSPGSEVNLTVALVWKGKQGHSFGTRVTHTLRLTGPVTFDRFEDEGEAVPLNDVKKHRDFWHRLWQGQFDERRRRLTLDCKYSFAFEPSRSSNARMDTIVDIDDDETGMQHGKLKSGMILSAATLNALVPLISPGDRSLTRDELDALTTRAFASHANQAGEAQVKFRGRRGSTAALWMYPEVRMNTLVLQRASNVADTGHVPFMEEMTVRFPLPTQIHLIGTSSEENE